MAWWSSIFGKKDEGEGGVKKPMPPTYQELVARVDELEEQVSRERAAAAEKRRKIASRARDDQATMERYRNALEFYANAASWRKQGFEAYTPTDLDRGYKARKSLGKV